MNPYIYSSVSSASSFFFFVTPHPGKSLFVSTIVESNANVVPFKCFFSLAAILLKHFSRLSWLYFFKLSIIVNELIIQFIFLYPFPC